MKGFVMDQETALRDRSAPDLPDGAWRTTVAIRFSHCDPAGIVYFARYFDLLNGVVEDWFGAALGIDYHEMIGPRRIGLGYVSAAADFSMPGFMGDRLECAVVVERIGRTSLALRIHALRAAANAPENRSLSFAAADRPFAPGDAPPDGRTAGSDPNADTTSGSDALEPVLQARLVIVTTSLATHTAIPLPDDLRDALERYQENCQ
jgi:4-hydroxybenzoyl-CoA thioesterase